MASLHRHSSRRNKATHPFKGNETLVGLKLKRDGGNGYELTADG
jgi:hypothetical protein